MRLAVFADVHANDHALEAIRADMGERGFDMSVCLGDIVGYNARPRECVECVGATTDIVVAGNHDRDVLRTTACLGTSSSARLVQMWTALQLEDAHLGYLDSLPGRVVWDDAFVALHGCYLNDSHVSGYVTGTMLEANLQRIADRGNWPRLAFCGHTHIPMCGWLAGGECVDERAAGRLEWPADANAVLINPGAVGQPRDGDPRAAYAMVDTTRRSVEFIRVAYDVGAAQAAIRDASLPDTLAERLAEGR
jgi:predicted phosphodiesterase